MNTQSWEREYVAVGRVVAPHGIRGEVKVELLTDYPERFRAGERMFLAQGVDLHEVTIATARPHQNAMLVRFNTTTDRNAAELLRDVYIVIPETEAKAVGEHENYAHDLFGLSVETGDGEVLGKLVEILTTAANDVYVVKRPSGPDLLIPALRDVIARVDLDSGRIVVVLPDGLLDAAG